MGETGKRSRSNNENSVDNKGAKKRGSGKDDKDKGQIIVYRILCPNGLIGSVIGKGGKMIKSIRQETGAKVVVVDAHPGAQQRVVTIFCNIPEKEEVEVDEEFEEREPLCTAQSALLKVHSVISDSGAYADKNDKDSTECHLLVPSSQAANLIGKAGSTIKKLRSKTKANVVVTSKDVTDPTHSCALDFDNFVKITGEAEDVKRALYAISAIMYKFNPREDIPLDKTVSEAPPSIIIPSDVPIYPAGGFYPAVDPTISGRSVPPLLGSAYASELSGYGDAGSALPSLYSSALPVHSGYGTGGSRSEELVVKVLCPGDKIGRVIGKGGSSIKNMRQVTGAHVDVEDSKNHKDEFVIIVKSTESIEDRKSMAVDAVLLLQAKINDDDEDNVTIRLLVPGKVLGFIIGKGGAIINEMRKRTRAEIHISKGVKPKCAASNEELIEVMGDVANVRDALVQLVTRLREDVLNIRDKDQDFNSSAGADYSSGAGFPVSSVLPHVPTASSLGYEPTTEPSSGLGMLSSSNYYGYGSMQTGGENGYGSLSSYSSKLYGGLSAPSNLEMLVPASSVGKVMGKGGANIANIRKISGASIEISEAKSVRGDRIALISGTSDQKKAAENLIQAFIMAV